MHEDQSTTSTNASARRPHATLVVIVLVCGGLGGCAWWPWRHQKPAPVTSAPTTAVATPMPPVDVQPASAAKAACANYAEAYRQSPFPRDAIIRGVDSGSASVRFLVDQSTISVLSVASSDSAFGNAALAIVYKLECHVDRPTQFQIPFEWRTSH